MDRAAVEELLDVIARNAKRLQRLADDILDVTKIESQSLELKKRTNQCKWCDIKYRTGN